VSLEQTFARGSSPLHRLEPRVKLLAAAVYIVTLAFLTDLRVLSAALVLSTGLVLLARLHPMKVLGRLLLANLFIVFLWAFLPWSVPGTPLWRLGPLTLTFEGVGLATLITLKCNAILAATMALLATSPTHELAAALSRLRAPRKLLVLFYLCLRYLQLIHAESLRLRQAAAVRGFVPGTNLATYHTYAGLLGALLVRSHERAVRVYDAMLCRGFAGRFGLLDAREPRIADLLGGTVVVSSAALLGILEWQLLR
jgi:cobalt/nickel transport system permease protein